MMSVISAVAQFERDLLLERTLESDLVVLQHSMKNNNFL